ncbi:MAG: GldG family protein [Planctomycetes bacterium]|nr:GldG family protein [Planctomycetota bacterium]
MKRTLLAMGREAGFALVALYVLILATGIAFNHPVRFDTTFRGQNTLSGETRLVLEELKEPIEVVIAHRFLPLHVAGDDLRIEVFDRARALLREYTLLSDRIRIVADIDVNQRGVEWEEAKKRYNLAGWNRVCFVRDRAREDVRVEEMAELELPRGPRPGRILRTSIEKAFTSAIKRLAMGERRKVYFLAQAPVAGIVPPSIDDPSPGGLSQLRDELRASNYEVEELRLSEKGRIPADCSVLWIAAPIPSFSADEAAEIRRYLEAGGRSIVAIHPVWRLGDLGEILKSFGVQVEDASIVRRVSDPLTQQYRVTDDIVTRVFNEFHVATRRLPKNAAVFAVVGARPITILDVRGVQVEPLIETERSPDIWGDWKRDGRRDPEDVASPMHLAVAVRRPGHGPSAEKDETRIAVFGSHTFLSNLQIQGWFHRDIALNTLYWVQGREDLVSISPREGRIPRIEVGDPGVLQGLFWSSVLIVPGLAIVLGAIVWAVRRR